MNAEINLTRADLDKIICKHIENLLGRPASTVDFKMSPRNWVIGATVQVDCTKTIRESLADNIYAPGTR